MDDKLKQRIGAALGRIPSGLYVLTAAHEDRRSGMLASWVQQVCFEPPMVSVAVAKGRPIMPLISESRRFGLCQIGDKDKMMLRKFAGGVEPNEDPFLGLELVPQPAGAAPLVANVVAWLACELTCHMDVEGDHDLFVGTVRDGNYTSGNPTVHLRTDGFKY